MKKSVIWKSVGLFALLMFTGVVLYAQGSADSTVYEVRMRDGTVLTGTIVNQDADKVVLHTAMTGDVTLHRADIAEMNVRHGSLNKKTGEYWFENPHASRYLFGPSAIPLRKGEGYYQNTYLLLNTAHYGVTDHFSIGGGFEILSLFQGNPIFFVMPKVSGEVAKNVNLGAGAMFVAIPGEGSATLLYGVGTYGNSNYNFTLGAGYGLSQGEIMDRPIISFSGMARISRKLALVTENWTIPVYSMSSDFGPASFNWNYYGIYSYGLRFLGENISVDLAFLNNREISEVLVIGVPYIDFAVKF